MRDDKRDDAQAKKAKKELANQKKQHVENIKNAQLHQALQAALSASSGKKNATLDSLDGFGISGIVDEYGQGAASDRLQFGYAPAIYEEAVAFHSLISAKEWIANRKRNGQIAFVKKQKLHKPNCEPIVTMLKLKRYWSELNELGSKLREGTTGMSIDAADAFLEALSAQQGVPIAGDEELKAPPADVTKQNPPSANEEREKKKKRMEML